MTNLTDISIPIKAEIMNNLWKGIRTYITLISEWNCTNSVVNLLYMMNYFTLDLPGKLEINNVGFFILNTRFHSTSFTGNDFHFSCNLCRPLPHCRLPLRFLFAEHCWEHLLFLFSITHTRTAFNELSYSSSSNLSMSNNRQHWVCRYVYPMPLWYIDWSLC